MTAKITKKILAVFLCVLFICSSFSIAGSAADYEYTYDNLTYTITTDGVKIVSCKENTRGEVKIPAKISGYLVKEIDKNTFSACTLIESIILPSTVKKIGQYAFAYCNYLKSVTVPSSVKSIGIKAFEHSSNVTVKCVAASYADEYARSYKIPVEYITNIYNLGEETYSFDNFSICYNTEQSCYDDGGHCFGMSSTSSGYYMGKLDKSIVDIDSSQEVYGLEFNHKVTDPICFYQIRQGFARDLSMVAGGSYYKKDKYNISSDWTSVVDYVKNHNYDNKGSLQIGIRKMNRGGHAINFLYYKVVDGQERIYAYDNNFPDTEVYFYRSSDGNVYEAPYQTFSGSLDCITLRNISTYFTFAAKYNVTRAIYSTDHSIKVDGAKKYYMECGVTTDESVVFEIPEKESEVSIIPLQENASFTYLGKEYSLKGADVGSVVSLTLSNSEDEEPVISFDKTSKLTVNDVTLNYKATANLSPVYTGEPGVRYSFEYSSSDPSVARVDENGKIYGASKGTATVTCTVTDSLGNKVSDTCKVTVKYAWWQSLIRIVLFGWLWY